MSDPLLLGVLSGEEKLSKRTVLTKNTRIVFRKNGAIFSAILLLILGLTMKLWNAQPVFYVHAYVGNQHAADKIQSSLLEDEHLELFAKNGNYSLRKSAADSQLKKQNRGSEKDSSQFAQKIYAIVGDSPIKEMVPFISQRDEKVAAFLVGIAKKESSFGSASPLKNGETCYNYWGYKGSAGNGSALGYACFASAQEAVETVGNRIEVLVGKDRSTPARMVNTWKCGSDCSGDPGAPSWVSTVALIFNKIIS